MPDKTTNRDDDTLSSRGGPRDAAARDQTVEVERVTEVTQHAGGDRSLVESETVRATPRTPRQRSVAVIATVAIVAVFAVIALLLWRSGRASDTTEVKVNAEAAKAAGGEEHGAGEEHAEGGEVMLTPEARAAAGIEIEGVTERPAVALLRVTGTVETNQQQTQQVTPLVSGRVEQVRVALGDYVSSGSVIAVISSPEVAEMHGKLREAETRLNSAQRNLQRVQRAESRVAVLQSKARLDEAEATLRRTRRLIELGAGAGKDLIAAEAAHRSAKAEYDYQSNISLNREVQLAQAELDASRTEVNHLRQSLGALGASVPANATSGNISLVTVRAPVSGKVVERQVNAGAGVQPGSAMFTVANVSTVWVMANVPEAQMQLMRPGAPAEVRSAALGDQVLYGRVGYIDPRLVEETRTGRVRVELPNPGERLRPGMFVEVGFQAGTAGGGAGGRELVVREEAVQRIGERTVVFVPKDTEENAFEVREVKIGSVSDGYARIVEGLQLGERVVTKGSFTLKTQMQKGEMGEHDH
ncbi:MAG TPA: efflux RND transporter periplasmic adaptor subunit [Pyrinomonadaceae bacterium]